MTGEMRYIEWLLMEDFTEKKLLVERVGDL
jgi:hypothetical protein